MKFGSRAMAGGGMRPTKCLELGLQFFLKCNLIGRAQFANDAFHLGEGGGVGGARGGRGSCGSGSMSGAQQAIVRDKGLER